REPRSRTWTEDWLVPTLLLALILLVSLQFFLTSRGESPVVRDLAARYLMLLELQRTGEVDLRGNLGQPVPLVHPPDRPPGTGGGGGVPRRLPVRLRPGPRLRAGGKDDDRPDPRGPVRARRSEDRRAAFPPAELRLHGPGAAHEDAPPLPTARGAGHRGAPG